MEKTTRIALAIGFSITVGGLIFILLGEGIVYLANLFNNPSGINFGSSLAGTGYAMIIVLFIVLVTLVGYVLYQHSQNNSSWSGF